MTLAVTPGVRFISNRNGKSRMPQTGTPQALDPADRMILLDWVARRAGGGEAITIADLSARPWRTSGACAIIGVFESGKAAASWLVVGQDGVWTLARCADGWVSVPSRSLEDMLMLIDDPWQEQ